MEIVPGLYRLPRVGQGANAYLWRPEKGDGRTLVLFDCGWPWSGRGLVSSLTALGCRPEDIEVIAITHDDIDHAGWAAPLAALSGAEVIAHELEAPRLASRTWRTVPGNGGPVNWMRPAVGLLYRWWPHRPVRVTMPVRDGESLPWGWTVVHTPGHTPGHAAYFHPGLRVLIAGDALARRLAGGLMAPKSAYTEDTDAAMRSVRRLAQLRPEVVCLGHGRPVYNAYRLLDPFLNSPHSTRSGNHARLG